MGYIDLTMLSPLHETLECLGDLNPCVGPIPIRNVRTQVPTHGTKCPTQRGATTLHGTVHCGNKPRPFRMETNLIDHDQ